MSLSLIRSTMLSLAVSVGFALPVALAGPAAAQSAIKLYAAETMAPFMAELSAEFQKATAGKFKLEPTVGSSAALRERIEKGEGAHVFAASDAADAKKLSDAGRTRGPAVKFGLAGGREHVFVVLKDAPPAAGELAGFLRYGAGQGVLKRNGFSSP